MTILAIDIHDSEIPFDEAHKFVNVDSSVSKTDDEADESKTLYKS